MFSKICMAAAAMVLSADARTHNHQAIVVDLDNVSVVNLQQVPNLELMSMKKRQKNQCNCNCSEEGMCCCACANDDKVAARCNRKQKPQEEDEEPDYYGAIDYPYPDSTAQYGYYAYDY